jgi:hypothetical protein
MVNSCFALFTSAMVSQTFAQGQYIFEGEATWIWEASVDSGATWVRDRIEVDASERSVWIRSYLSFPPVAPGGYFNAVSLDATITNAGSSTITDRIDNLHYGFNGARPSYQQQVFGNVLKIDTGFDPLPPGQGTGWLSLGQLVVAPGQSRANPIGMVNFALNLDGTLGDRSIDGVFRQRSNFPSGHVVIIALTPFIETDFLVPFLHHAPFTVSVVPTPTSVTVVVAGLVMGTRRLR